VALAGKQAAIGSSTREGAWYYSVFRFLELGRMKDAGGACGGAAAVDQKTGS